MRSTLILATLLSSLFGPVDASASGEARDENQPIETDAETVIDSEHDSDIPWTWEDVDD